MDDLTKLPAPPKGQTGLSPDVFSHLPPPPKGQVGIHPDQIGSIPQPQQTPAAPMPLSSGNSSNNFGKNLVTAGKGIALGAIKGVSEGLQSFGKSALGSVGSYQGGTQERPGARNTGTFQPFIDPSKVGIPEQAFKSNNRAEQVGKVLETAAEIAAPFAGGTAEKLVAKGKSLYDAMQVGREAKATADATAKVTEMIAPKATVKEAKLAQTQGRLVQGKEPTLFRAGTGDSIAPSKKTLSATDTIVKNIPKASEMSPQDLYKAVDNKITETATNLRPQMEATPIKPETIEKINNDWEALKKTQMADAPATEEANVAKRQAKFEATLKKSGSGSHADLWDTRIAYDESIPDNVKKANSMSSDSLQLQKEEWLQNRAVLNNAIDASAKPEFKTMSDLYEAKTGLTSKAKVNEARMSKVNQFLKDNPKVAAGLGGATVYEVAKHLGLPLP